MEDLKLLPHHLDVLIARHQFSAEGDWNNYLNLIKK